MENEDDEVIETRDSNGVLLENGDTVVIVKDLKVKGSSVVLKQGTVVKNIHLTDDEELIECRVEGMKGLMLRTEFLKKKS